MKGTFFVSIFMAIMVLIGANMTPTNSDDISPEFEISIEEISNF